MAGSPARAKVRTILAIITLATLPLYCLGYFVMQRAQSQLKLNFATLASASTRVQTLQVFATATDAPVPPGGSATLSGPAIIPTPAPAVIPTQSPVPEEFVRQYFQLIEQRDYSQTWAMLSDHYRQQNNSTGYQPYVNFWNTIQSMSIGNVQPISQDPQSARLQAQLTFHFTGGKTSTQTITFSLVSDAASGSWLIDDTY
jgi:hypothetical protein